MRTLAVPPGGHRIIETPDSLRNVALRREYLEHLVRKPKDHREVWANRIVPTLSLPLEVWLAEMPRKSGRSVYRRRFVAQFDDARATYAVVQENADSSIIWTFLRRRDVDERREGFLLYRRSGG